MLVRNHPLMLARARTNPLIAHDLLGRDGGTPRADGRWPGTGVLAHAAAFDQLGEVS